MPTKKRFVWCCHERKDTCDNNGVLNFCQWVIFLNFPNFPKKIKHNYTKILTFINYALAFPKLGFHTLEFHPYIAIPGQGMPTNFAINFLSTKIPNNIEIWYFTRS